MPIYGILGFIIAHLEHDVIATLLLTLETFIEQIEHSPNIALYIKQTFVLCSRIVIYKGQCSKNTAKPLITFDLSSKTQCDKVAYIENFSLAGKGFN